MDWSPTGLNRQCIEIKGQYCSISRSAWALLSQLVMTNEPTWTAGSHLGGTIMKGISVSIFALSILAMFGFSTASFASEGPVMEDPQATVLNLNALPSSSAKTSCSESASADFPMNWDASISDAGAYLTGVEDISLHTTCRCTTTTHCYGKYPHRKCNTTTRCTGC